LPLLNLEGRQLRQGNFPQTGRDVKTNDALIALIGRRTDPRTGKVPKLHIKILAKSELRGRHKCASVHLNKQLGKTPLGIPLRSLDRLAIVAAVPTVDLDPGRVGRTPFDMSPRHS
jgi:hypothetical protein